MVATLTRPRAGSSKSNSKSGASCPANAASSSFLRVALVDRRPFGASLLESFGETFGSSGLPYRLSLLLKVLPPPGAYSVDLAAVSWRQVWKCRVCVQGLAVDDASRASIRVLREWRLKDWPSLERNPLRRFRRDRVDGRPHQNLAATAHISPPTPRKRQPVVENGDRARCIASVFDEHIDVQSSAVGKRRSRFGVA